MTPERKAKKDYLSRYFWHQKKADEIWQEILQCRQGMLPGSPKYDGMPHGSGYERDLSDHFVKLDELYPTLIDAHDRCLRSYEEIFQAIEAVKEPKYNVLLRYRYIQCKAWAFIADKMGYSEMYCKQELQDAALDAFEIPEGYEEDETSC